MRFEISVESVQQTTRCDSCHACLNDPHFEVCGMDVSLGEDPDFIRCRRRRCFYNTRHGNEFVCFCPVRNAIHQKYRI
jgi:hypothetical protein